MTTSKPTKASEDPQTSSLPDGPAKTSPIWELVKVSKVTGRVSGQKLPELLAMYSRDSSSWKTSQRCLVDGLQTFLETWPRSGMTVSGIAYQLPPLALRTAVIGSGLLPTPTAVDYGSNQGGRNPGHKRHSLQSLARQGLLPTPKASPSGPDYARVNRPNSGGDDLATAVAREATRAYQLGMTKKPSHSIPTPTASDHIKRKSTSTEEMNFDTNKTVSLDRWVDAFPTKVPTPTAMDYKGRGAGSYERHKGLDNFVKLWPTKVPTPTAGDSRSSGSRNTENSKANAGVSLTDFVRGDQGEGRQVATPDANCWKGGNRKAQLTDPSYGILPTTGQLNPTWVEWLMGFPTGWTDLEPSETE